MEKEKLIEKIFEASKNKNVKEIEIPEQYKKDFDVAMAIAKTNGVFITKVDKSIWNRELILEALKSNQYAQQHVPDELYDDKEIVLLIVNKNGNILWKVSERLKDDIDVVGAAVKNDPNAMKFASERLKASEELKAIFASAKEEQRREEEKYKIELENKVKEFKNKPIWWQDEGIVNDVKLNNIVTPELIDMAEKELGYKLPNSYLELLMEQNGGRLIKKHCYLPQYHDYMVFVIDRILGISTDRKKGIVGENYYYLDYINKENVVIFGRGEGHIYYLFDYNDLSADNEPKIIYYDEEREEEIEIASNFKEFKENLKIHEEVDLIYW